MVPSKDAARVSCRVVEFDTEEEALAAAAAMFAADPRRIPSGPPREHDGKWYVVQFLPRPQ